MIQKVMTETQKLVFCNYMQSLIDISVGRYSPITEVSVSAYVLELSADI